MAERASRHATFKNAGKGIAELRRKRAELSVTLRKQSRDNQLLKRRALSPEKGKFEFDDNEPLPPPEVIVQGLKSAALMEVMKAACQARRMLSREQNPPIVLLINAGVIKPLVDALDRDESPDLQFEAAWALTNIASGTTEQTMAVVDGGALPKLIGLLSAGGVVTEQSAWALGNIAGDGPEFRDRVLKEGALTELLPCLRTNAPASQIRTAVWTYSNFCRNKSPLVNFAYVSPALPYISDLLELKDQDVLTDACWALSYLSDGPNERIEEVQATPWLLERLVRLLDHNAASVKTPALRAIGNMVTGSDEQTDRCINVGCLDYLVKLLRCGKPSLVKEAAWAASNIIAGTEQQIQRCIEAGILDHLVLVLANEDARCQKEAAWAITNLCMGGTGPQLAALLHAGALQPYCLLLNSPDVRMVTVILEGLTNLLQTAVKFGELDQLCLKLEEIGALDIIENLQNHENEQIFTKTSHIIDTFFGETEDQSAKPQQTNEEYQFGTSDNQIGDF